MNKTNREGIQIVVSPICLPLEEFAKTLGTGVDAAREIAEMAEARVRIGKRIVINVQKATEYLYQISE